MKLKIREALKYKGMTSSEMAKILGVSPGTFSGYVTGSHDPKSENLVRIAKTCGVTVDYLVGLTNSPTELYNHRKSPASQAETGEEFNIIDLMYDVLVSSGAIENGYDLTDMEARVIYAAIQVLDVAFPGISLFGRNAALSGGGDHASRAASK